MGCSLIFIAVKGQEMNDHACCSCCCPFFGSDRNFITTRGASFLYGNFNEGIESVALHMRVYQAVMEDYQPVYAKVVTAPFGYFASLVHLCYAWVTVGLLLVLSITILKLLVDIDHLIGQIYLWTSETYEKQIISRDAHKNESACKGLRSSWPIEK